MGAIDEIKKCRNDMRKSGAMILITLIFIERLFSYSFGVWIFRGLIIWFIPFHLFNELEIWNKLRRLAKYHY